MDLTVKTLNSQNSHATRVDKEFLKDPKIENSILKIQEIGSFPPSQFSQIPDGQPDPPIVDATLSVPQFQEEKLDTSGDVQGNIPPEFDVETEFLKHLIANGPAMLGLPTPNVNPLPLCPPLIPRASVPNPNG